MRFRNLSVAAVLASALALASCGQSEGVASVGTVAAPVAETVPSIGQSSIEEIVAQMSLERKVAQLIQPQIASITPEDMERYRFGSYLNGGNGGPGGDEYAPAEEWLKYADDMWLASTKPLPKGEFAIPTMWGTDAVHGHSNIVGATLFPHNIALGATRDADLVRRIGAATAAEIEVTGMDWNFSPTVAVARDDRWGRTYESYSENPQLTGELGAALIEGLQGRKGADDYLGTGRVIATAKHFFGDGGTDQGVDQGDVNGDLDELKAIHVAPYPPAIAAGVETIMASFNSINGRKMHGREDLLTGVLRGELGFEGLVVGDWNAHGQIAGCTVSNCPKALMAGLDIYMVPDDWKELHESLVAQVNDGTIPMARIDEAVTRVLRVKKNAGLLEDGAAKPSARPNAADYAQLGSVEHRAIAREAVAKSQVILKNNGVLPLKDGASILVAGIAADSIAQASGGWTLTWQGGRELTNDYFPGATSIWSGIKQAAEKQGSTAALSADGAYETKPDVAIVVFGEEPYAEFSGDKKNLILDDLEGLGLLRKYDTEGIPTVAVFLSGRAMWMNRELNASDAFVASWLPGSEGAGVADVLFGASEATGRLSFNWPALCNGAPLNSADGALFAFGYGRSFADTEGTPELSEACSLLDGNAAADWYSNGRLAAEISATAGGKDLPNLRGQADGISARGIDRNRQEDAREITFSAGSTLTLSQADTGQGGYRILYSLADLPTQPVTMTVGNEVIDVTAGMAISAGKGWREMVITQACVPTNGDSIAITSAGPLTLQVATIARQEMPEGTKCSF